MRLREDACRPPTLLAAPGPDTLATREPHLPSVRRGHEVCGEAARKRDGPRAARSTLGLEGSHTRIDTVVIDDHDVHAVDKRDDGSGEDAWSSEAWTSQTWPARAGGAVPGAEPGSPLPPHPTSSTAEAAIVRRIH